MKDIKNLNIGDELIKIDYTFGMIVGYYFEKIKESYDDKYIFESGNVEYKNRLASYHINKKDNIDKIEEIIKNQKVIDVKTVISKIFSK